MNNGFDRPEDLQRMQQEAIRRVQEMQARARSSLEKSQPAPEPAQQQGRRPLAGNNRPHLNEERRTGNSRPPEPRPAPPPGEPPAEQHRPVVAAHAPPKREGITDIFDALLSDSERTLILLLILLLVDEKADTGLILALMYLII